MSKAVLVIDMPSSCSKCKFMYEFYGVKKCQLLNILENGGKAIIPTDTLTSERKECCPLRELPNKIGTEEALKMPRNGCISDVIHSYNACIDELLKGEEG